MGPRYKVCRTSTTERPSSSPHGVRAITARESIVIIDAALAQLSARRQVLEDELGVKVVEIIQAEWDLFLARLPTYPFLKALLPNPPPTNTLLPVAQSGTNGGLQEVKASVHKENSPDLSPSAPRQQEHRRRLHIAKCKSTVDSLVEKASDIFCMKKQFDREIVNFRHLRRYGVSHGCSPTQPKQVEGEKREISAVANMTKRASGRANSSSSAAASKPANPLSLHRRREGNTTAQLSSAGAHKNASPSAALHSSSSSSVYPSGEPVVSHQAQDLLHPGQGFSTRPPTHIFQSDNTSNSNSTANYCTPLPSSGELAWETGIDGDNSWGGGPPSSILPSVTIGEGGVVGEISKLLCHATIMELFQVQQLVENELNNVSQFVCSSQPAPVTWDSGSLESATLMSQQQQQLGPDGGSTVSDRTWQMSALDPWASSSPDWT